MAKPGIRLLAANLGIAIAYCVTAQLSMSFSTLPGTVAAIWLPSGMTLALVDRMGTQAFPGIILGSIVGLVSDLLKLNPPLSIASIALLTLVFTALNCLQPLIGIAIIKRLTGAAPAFERVRSVSTFVLAALISPLSTATIGVPTLYWAGASPWSSLLISWLTLWLASVVAHLLFSPPLFLYKARSRLHSRACWWEIVLLVALSLTLSWFAFVQSYHIEYTLLPILIWSVFRLGGFFTSILVSIISAIAIVETAQGGGLSIANAPTESLLLLQSFIAVCSVTTLVLSAVIQERKVAELALEKTLASLEQQVAERTAELQESQAILDGFFSVAPVGMGILDPDLQYVRINPILSEIHGALAQQIDRANNPSLPDLASRLEPIYQQVLTTRQPILNQEESYTNPLQPELEHTWLKFYFPILDGDRLLSKVGVIALNISDRKQLELQLKRQARKDELTSIPNRLHLQEASQQEWQRCRRLQQPFSLILLDIDEFKRYNDTYGHLAGDACLVQVANLLLTSVKRPTDLVARYGGEEFIILLPETDVQGATHVAHRIRRHIHQLQIPHQSSSIQPFVTASLGVATRIPTPELHITDLIQAADQALYESKGLGRDRITVAGCNHPDCHSNLV